MSLRVVAGTAKGRRLQSPPSDATRPSTNRVREAVFNSLYSLGEHDAISVLDLFAGTGAMGIEALSRGARHAVFVERDRSMAKVLRANLATTGLAERAEVMVTDVDAALGVLASGRDTEPDARERQGPARFDVAVIDPPYAFDDWPRLLSRVPARLVVAESDRVVDVGPGFTIHHHRRHGSTVVTFAQAVSEAGAAQ